MVPAAGVEVVAWAPWGCGVSAGVDVAAGSVRTGAVAGCSVATTAVGAVVASKPVDAAVPGELVVEPAATDGSDAVVEAVLDEAALALPDVVVPVCAPPELCTTPVRGSAIDAEVVEDDWVADPAVVDCVDPAVDPAAEVPDTEPEELGEDPADALDPDEDEVDEEDEAEEDAPDGSAHAMPCAFATAAPIPKATANGPTRPIYRAEPMMPPGYEALPFDQPLRPRRVSRSRVPSPVEFRRCFSDFCFPIFGECRGMRRQPRPVPYRCRQCVCATFVHSLYEATALSRFWTCMARVCGLAACAYPNGHPGNDWPYHRRRRDLIRCRSVG